MKNRELLERTQRDTSDKFGGRPELRSVEQLKDFGFLLIDKPAGPTSHQVSSYVQKILGIGKSGHAGTLDPKVTGVLPIATGRASRLLEFLLKAGKTYVCVMHLHGDVPRDKVDKAVEEFTGTITQLPPKRSAVARRKRKRTIYSFNVLEVKDRDILFECDVEAGTYIRKLCLAPETQILTPSGRSSAQDFFRSPQPIFSLDKDGRIIEKMPSATQRIRGPEEMIEIEMESGIVLTVTPDHEMLISEETGEHMVAAEHIEAGDYLVKSAEYTIPTVHWSVAELLDDDYLVDQPSVKSRVKQAFLDTYGSIREMHRQLKIDRKGYLSLSTAAIPIDHIKQSGVFFSIQDDIRGFKTHRGTRIELPGLNEDLFYLLGLIASDGNNTKEKHTSRHTRVKFHNTNEALVDTFLEVYGRIFPSVSISKRRIDDRIWQLDTSNSLLATLGASLGIQSPQKENDIHDVVYAKKPLVAAFLRGYFDGDGAAQCKRKAQGKNYWSSISLYSIDYTNAKRLHEMLLKLGIQSRIYQRKNSLLYAVSIATRASQHRFIKLVGTRHSEKSKVFQEILELPLRRGANPWGSLLMPFSFKNFVRKKRGGLSSMGGNVSRVLDSEVPMTRYFYSRAQSLVDLPEMPEVVVERVKGVRRVPGSEYVYDMTVPATHNFLVETGFVSSNCHDFGQFLGCGAHMAELRRTRSSYFKEDESVTLQQLTDAYAMAKEGDESALRKIFFPGERMVDRLPRIYVHDSAVSSLTHGASLKIPGVQALDSKIKPGDTVRILTQKDELVAVGIARMSSNQMLQKASGVAAKPQKVFLPEDVYPRMD